MEFLILLLSPFVAATGLYPKKFLPKNPVFSFRAYSVAFIICAFFHHLFVNSPPPDKFYITIVGILVSYFFIILLLSPRWQVAALMSWVGTDLIFFITGFHSAKVDWSLLLIYFLRNAAEVYISRKDNK